MTALPADLRIDASYRNTNNWQHPLDTFNRFFRFSDGKGINNTSGFRPKSKAGSADIVDCAFCLLVSNFEESEWPDAIDRENGTFTYYGDNRSAGRPIANTTVGGNRLLEKIFTALHTNDRSTIPPFLCFEKYKTDLGTQMRFLGLACPGAQGMSGLDDLVAVWRVQGDLRFQNYRATFTVLKEASIPHAWLQDMVDGLAAADSPHCPASWKLWQRSGKYTPLRTIRRRLPRTQIEQLPHNAVERGVLQQIVETLTPREFEFLAASLLEIMDERFIEITVTRAVKDGGRDVVASYRVGHNLHQVLLQVCVEAKKWQGESPVGVKPMMRLLSRLKHRDLGVFVTTSYFERQVQEELIEDGHPVLLVSGGDIARALIGAQIGGEGAEARLQTWLEAVRADALAD